jgi:hypothetical protein
MHSTAPFLHKGTIARIKLAINARSFPRFYSDQFGGLEQD